LHRDNSKGCAPLLLKLETNSADSLKKPELLLLLKHHYKVRVSATMKLADLKELFTSTVAALDIIDAGSGVGTTLEDNESLSSDDEDE
jgi:hypothetical protein